jgi:transglutaminase-like putative cysteine protease
VQVVSATASLHLLAPGRAVAYRGPGVIEADAIGNLTITGAPSAVTPSRAYDVVSVAPTASQAALAAAHGPDPADKRWLQLPSDLSSEARTLARELTRGAPDRVAAVESIERYLRANETYSLSAPLPADGVDAVDDFRFASHQGSCEQFATAEVMLLRSVGIPSRLVTGYARGDVSLEPGKLVMRESDAHAWAQVWYPGIGWVNSDPTPSGPPTAAAASPAPAVSSWPIAVLSASWAQVLGRWWPVPFAVILIMCAAGRITRRRRRSTKVPAGPTAVGGQGSGTSCRDTAVGPIAQACLRLADSGSAGGRQPAETLREVAERVGVSAAASPTARAALEAMDRECYSRRPPTAADAAAAAHMFDQALADASARPLTLSR